MNHRVIAEEMFRKGYNCAQAVVCAFSDTLGISERHAAILASSFGGGMGRMRETCGAVSGMLLVAGQLWGYGTPGDDEAKAVHYRLVQKIAGKFRERAGSIVCRDLLGNPSSDPTPTPRTESFYQSRPCLGFVGLAAAILDEELAARETKGHTDLPPKSE